MELLQLPKIELHLHLDCSLSYQVVQKLRPDISEAEYRAAFIGPPKCHDLADFLTRAINGVKLMQTGEALRLVTDDLFDQLLADGVLYAEIRFAPLLHTEEGLTPREVVDIINEATVAAIARTGVKAGLILCTLRHYNREQSLETVRLVEQFAGTSVVGFDIAADEAGFPIDAHIEAFQYAREKGIHCTAHAGEARGADSVWETLQNFHPQRIGHGVRSIEDPQLIDHLKALNIHLEVCPTSNIQTNIYDTMRDHVVDQLYRSGISLSINTDARTISDVTLRREYQNLIDTFQWEKAHFLKCNLEALEHAFIGAAEKEQLRERLLAAWL
ncbi:adenosine deaminase [Flavilitoribacter nigricans]|uniref:adenosine deaminase n=1 Tax=Flavilitoribacter nigricans (strain ATCC 23147 / DSM 23189 / NBRC 102662 / NCIMB 1420 / SS-2) TaxID=1122177 RepID=A0A2D0NI23_FLAN2|nr:adenosine deaminase [Flavilitoribacter nigricans]PHN08117.1 adenosine deaminase [Flavilitoribacter nigricans DSM 23189 = NBRC 102662]